ncbi:hypothetical protein ACQP1O_18305 [Nocardia sp. CA-151230]|uniref:hypothetical protein n=1 Tax=Nocardia sp. CA-151230 TaxID=3239982 RepID=UPI003D8BBEE3
MARYSDPGERHRDTLLLITTRPALREAFLVRWNPCGLGGGEHLERSPQSASG